MFRQLHKDEAGIVLVTVLIITFALIIFTLSTVHIKTTQAVKLSQYSDSLVAEELAKLYYWRLYYGPLPQNIYTEDVNGRTYTISIGESSPGPPPTYQINVTY